jgi:hypothetical protein
MRLIQNPFSTCVHRSSVAGAVTVEALESRQMLSAGPWSQQDKQVGLDLAVQNYPALTGAGETVAIIDQGVDYNHPSLGGGYGNKIVDSWNFDTGSWDTFPYDDAHGTGTAGAIAADPHYVDGVLQQGIAPGVKLISLRASGSYNIKQAFDWIINHKAQYNIVAVNYLDQSGADESAFVDELRTLNNSGVFMAGAIGNYGPGPGYGHIEDLIHSVGSVDASDQLSGFTPRGPELDLVAPGENVDVTWYYSGIHADLPSTGTSWTAPQVTGTAALIKQINPAFSADQVYQIIRNSAHWVYDAYSNANYPRLDVNAALGLAYQLSGQAHTKGSSGGSSGGSTKKGVAAPPAGSQGGAQKSVNAPAGIGSASSSSFTGTPFPTGTPFLAANYDNGGEGVAYHDTTAFNEGGDAYRAGAADTTWSASQNTEIVGWTHAGEWMNYTVSVAKTGTFSFLANVASPVAGGTFHLEVDGRKASGSIAVPKTGSWDVFATQTVKGIKLRSGRHVIRVVMDRASSTGTVGNFNWFAVGAPPVATAAVRRKRK